ncbi:MAG: iron dicitrate transport regulator FecR, partial [Cyanobium sp.]
MEIRLATMRTVPRPPRPRPVLIAFSTLAAATAGPLLIQPTPLRAAAPTPWVVEVPDRPAFVRPPTSQEVPARSGQTLPTDTVLRTTRPGRLQVRLGNGREFRLGGDAVLRLGSGALELQRGQIIAWV